MLLTEQCALVEGLVARRYIQRRVLVEEVHRLHMDLQNLTRHDREVFDPGNVIDARLNVENKVGILDVLVPPCP